MCKGGGKPVQLEMVMRREGRMTFLVKAVKSAWPSHLAGACVGAVGSAGNNFPASYKA